MCVSVAWDWQFLGHTPRAINEELTVCMDASMVNMTKRLQSLAVPEVSILYLAIEYLAQFKVKSSNLESFVQLQCATRSKNQHGIKPDPGFVLNGILPSLQKLVMQHKEFYDQVHKSNDVFKVQETPNAHEYRATAPTNPFGDDYFCKICNKELSNIYMHCDGCEDILSKDFNICTECYRAKWYTGFIQMHPTEAVAWSNINHVCVYSGNCDCLKKERKLPAPFCSKCSTCSACSCTCHRSFTLNFRFMTIEDEINLLNSIKWITHT